MQKMLTTKRIVCDGILNHFLDWETRIKFRFKKKIDFYEIRDYNTIQCTAITQNILYSFSKGIKFD